MQNPADSEKYQVMKARSDPNRYVRLWKVPLLNTLPERPGFCCYATWCTWCASYQLRKQALYGDMTRYVCCQGACPCSGRMGEQKCPECCLCMEVFFCFATSVSVTRFMIQDELRIQSSKCDNCIIGTMIVLEYIACICHIVACITGSNEIAQAAQIVQCIADIVWCSVCGCMQTQHKIELDERDKNPGAAQAPAPMRAPAPQAIPVGGAPPHGAPPPGYGAPPPGYGAPPPGYGAPPPGYGAPPPGYGAPPPGYGAPPPGYGAPPPGYGAPPPGYGAPPPGAYPPPQQAMK